MSTLLLQTKKTPKFSLKGQSHIAKCVKCYDADSIHVVILLHDVYTKFNCRLLGIDTAELRTKDMEERAFAIKSRDFLRELVLDKLVVISCDNFDKYGRLLINLYEYNDTDILNQKGGSINPDQEIYNWENSIKTWMRCITMKKQNAVDNQK